MIAALLGAALVVDLALAVLAAGAAGLSRVVGPLHIRLHDPHPFLLAAALLSGGLVVSCWRTRARGWSLAVGVAAVTIPAVALTRSAQEIFPLGDIAVIELYVRNALSGRLLVGPYSRFGWHHPGPIYFYVLAPFYALASDATASLAAGSAFVAMGAIALLAWAGARSLRPRAAAVILAATLVYVWRVPGLTVSAWNPHIVVLPALALVVGASAAAGGAAVLLPVVVAVASLIVQTDVALVPVAAALTAAACAGAVLSRWRADESDEHSGVRHPSDPEQKHSGVRHPSDPGQRAALKWLNASAWVALVLWLPPLAQELTRTPGNMTLLWRFFAASGRGQPFAHALAAWSAMLMAPMLGSFSLATGGTFETGRAALLVALASAQVAGVAAVALLMRRRDAGLSRLAAMSLAATFVALWSATRIADRIMDHEVFWISALGMLNVAAIAAALVTLLPPFPPERAGRIRGSQPIAVAHGAAVAGVALICFSQIERAHAGRLPVTLTAPAVERLAGGVRQYLEGRGAHKPLVLIGEDTWGLGAGVLLEMDRGAIPFAIEESWMPMFPESFAASGEEDAEVAFGNADEHAGRMATPGSEAIAAFSNVYVDGVPRGTHDR